MLALWPAGWCCSGDSNVQPGCVVDRPLPCSFMVPIRRHQRTCYHVLRQRTLDSRGSGLVPRYPLQKPPSKGLEGSGGEGEGRTKVWRSKKASPSEGFKGAWKGLHLRKGGLEGGFKGAWSLQGWRGLRGGLKGFKEGLKGAWKGFTFGRLQGGLKGASRGLEAFRRWRAEAPFKPPGSSLQAPFKASSPLQASWSLLEARFKPFWNLPEVKPLSSPLQAPLKPPGSLLQRWRLPAAFKPPWSPLEAPFKPLEAPFKPSLPKVKPPWSLPKVKPPLPDWESRTPFGGSSR